jgi:radical SAM/Cys-rich protein
MISSLKRQNHVLSNPEKQIRFLNENTPVELPNFVAKLRENNLSPLKPTGIEIFQMNLGKMCNQTCRHCHVDAGPDRKEVMSREIMQLCLEVLEKSKIQTVDITGGAPEMNPDFRWLIASLAEMGKKVMVRSNLTIIVSNPKYKDIPSFYRKHNVEVISSLPYFLPSRTDAQRGQGVFDRSIRAMRMLNEQGYGDPESGRILDLVYNPTGAFMPGSQLSLEAEFKMQLKERYDLVFNNLFVITNLPISRFLEYLIRTNNFQAYMEKLVDTFNPAAARGIMCRNTISVGWDGSLYDCDFNQMLNLKLNHGAPNHIRNFDLDKINNRRIVFDQHCYGCTAGSGSSCGGQTV